MFLNTNSPWAMGGHLLILSNNYFYVPCNVFVRKNMLTRTILEWTWSTDSISMVTSKLLLHSLEKSLNRVGVTLFQIIITESVYIYVLYRFPVLIQRLSLKIRISNIFPLPFSDWLLAKVNIHLNLRQNQSHYNFIVYTWIACIDDHCG